MGWKALKEKFNIRHHVQVEKNHVCIGSGFVPSIVAIDMQTGVLEENDAFGGFLRQHYPALLEATPQELLALIQAPDQFTAAVPVYTYENGSIVEKLCETPGWPNATHDGCMMFDNTHSTDKNQVVAWAKNNAAIEIQYREEGLVRQEKALEEARAMLADARRRQADLEATYPGVAAAR
jgi:hypothetical protein